MATKKFSTASEPNSPKEPLGKSAEKTADPTNCDSCGKRLGVWFSLADKAYCSPCFHAQFWTPFEGAKRTA